jgi:hypothetical protein
MIFTGMLLGLLLSLSIILALQLPLYVIGLVYVPLYLFLSLKYPGIALALIFAAAPFQHSLSGGSRSAGIMQFSIAEINLALIIPAMLLRCMTRRRAPLLGPITVPVLLYILVCLFSTRQEWRGNAALFSLAQMFLYLVVVVMLFSVYGEQRANLTFSFYGLLAVGCVLTLAEIVFQSYDVLGLKKNGIGASLSCAILLAADFWLQAEQKIQKLRMLGILAFLCVGLLLSLSRGAWLGTLCGLSVLVLLRGNYRLFLQGCLALIPLLAAAFFLLPEDKKFYATNFDTKRNWNMKARVYNNEFARKEYEKNPIWGVGVGLRKEFDATNVLWTTLAETGIMGLSTFLLIHVAFYSMIWRLRKKIPAQSFYFTCITLGAAMVMTKLVHGMVDHYWSRGQLTIVWACAGLAIGAFYMSRRRPIARNAMG